MAALPWFLFFWGGDIHPWIPRNIEGERRLSMFGTNREIVQLGCKGAAVVGKGVLADRMGQGQQSAAADGPTVGGGGGRGWRCMEIGSSDTIVRSTKKKRK